MIYLMTMSLGVTTNTTTLNTNLRLLERKNGLEWEELAMMRHSKQNLDKSILTKNVKKISLICQILKEKLLMNN